MEKTAKRIGIALLAVLLVALLCAGIALALPQAETPLASADGSSALDTAIGSVTLGDQVYDLSNSQSANKYYQSLIELGYTEITDQTSLQKFLDENGRNSKAKGAMKPYDASGEPIPYTFGNTNKNSASPYNGANMGVNGIFQATLNGCGANVKVYVNQQWEGTYSTQHDSADAAKKQLLGSDTVTTILGGCGRSSLTGSLANTARNATVQNLNLTISDNATVLNGAKNRSGFIGGLFGAMYNTTIDNCSLNITSAITGTKVGVGGYEDVGYSVISIGGIAGYALNSTVSNFTLTLTGSITANCEGDDYRSGFPRAAASGIIGIAQGVTMYNMVVTGAGGLTADLNAAWDPGLAGNRKTHIARCGALIGITMSSGNAEAGTFGFSGHLGGTVTVNGVLTDYIGPAGYQDITGNDETWHDGNTGMLVGSCEAGALTNLYWNGGSVPSATAFAHNAGFTAVPVTANVKESKGTAQISFKNETGAVSSLSSGLQVTYTAPADSGSILWSYNDSGKPGEGSDMYSAQPYETYTIQWPRSFSEARNVEFTTGRRVKYYVRYNGEDITNNGGMDADPVDTKPFDNTPYVHPVLQMWSPDGTTSLGEVNDNTYWSINKEELASSWTTAVDVGTYNVRLIDAFKEDTAYDFIVADQKLIAYKSDNSNGASRNYVFEITQRELTLDITQPQFVYDGETQSLEFVLGKTVAGDDPQPSVTANYFNGEGTGIDAIQVVNAGDYFVTVTGVNDSNYFINAEDLAQYTNWKFSVAKKPITITPTGYEGLVYNGAPQYPSVDISNNDNQVVALNFFASEDPNFPLNEDERIDAGSYRMVAKLNDVANYILDNSDLTASDVISFDETSVTVNYGIAKADLEFVGDESFSFVYSASPVRTLSGLNQQAGTAAYFQPVDKNNTADKDIGSVGSDVKFTITAGPLTNAVITVGDYTIELSYESDNFNPATKTITVNVGQRPLTLNFTTPYETEFVYGNKPAYSFDSSATGAIAGDKLEFAIVYYEDDGDGAIKPENKREYAPEDAGSYIAAIEFVGAINDQTLACYRVSDESDNEIRYTITPAPLKIGFAGIPENNTMTYNGQEFAGVTIASLDGIIEDEQAIYDTDALQVLYVNSDNEAAASARNADTYTLAVVPDGEDELFARNYDIEQLPSFEIARMKLSLQLLDAAMDYVSVVGKSIPYEEGITHNTIGGEICGNDNEDESGNYLLQIFALAEEDTTETVINGLGSYLFSIRLNEANPNYGNYELELTSSKSGSEYPNAPYPVGTLTVGGTAVYHVIYGETESGFLTRETAIDDDHPYTYNIKVAYRGEDIKFRFAASTTAGDLGKLSFEDFTVTGDDIVEQGVSEDTKLPYFTVRNVGSYSTTWTIAQSLHGMFYFPTAAGDPTEQYTLTINVEVTPLDVQLVPDAVSVVYGDEIVYGGYTIADDEDGVKAAALAADNVKVEYSSAKSSTDGVDVYEGAINMTAAVDEAAKGNYNITCSSAALSVTPRAVTVQLTTPSAIATYGDPVPAVTEITAVEDTTLANVEGDAEALIEGVNANLVFDNKNVGNRHLVFAGGVDSMTIGNYVVSLAEGAGAVTITPKRLNVTVAPGKVAYGSENIVPVTEGQYYTAIDGVVDGDQSKLAFTYNYTGTAEITGLVPGNYDDALALTATGEAAGNYTLSCTNGTLTVEAIGISEANVSVELNDYTYTGAEIEYTVKINGAAVTEHIDVTIAKDGATVDKVLGAGSYTFTVTGDDNYYKGSVTATASVAKKNISDMEIGLNKTTETYTGSAITVTPTGNDGIAMTLAYAVKDGEAVDAMIDAGSYVVTLTPTDTANYDGSIEVEFTVDKADQSVPTAGDITVTVTTDSVTAVSASGKKVALSVDGGKTWSDNGVATGLAPATEYGVTVKYLGDANHNESEAAQLQPVTTDAMNAVGITIGTVEAHHNYVVISVTFGEADFAGKVQYSVNGGASKDVTPEGGKLTITGLAEDTDGIVIALSIPADATHVATDPVPVTVSTGVDPAKFNETLALFGETFTASNLTDYETLKAQYDGLTDADRKGVDSARYEQVADMREAFVAAVNNDIQDVQNVAAKTAGKAAAAAAAAVTAAAIALFVAKRKFI